jgi:hypothetical protein
MVCLSNITPLVGRMKKQQVKRKATKQAAIPVGRLIRELALWEFTGNEDIVRHYASELARAIQLGYNLENFGTQSFGLSEEE